MTLALNLIPLVLILIGAWLTIKHKRIWIPVVTGLLLFIYFQAQPSYLPKGEVKRTAVPQFEAKEDLVIEDRNSKPKDPDQRQAEQEAKYREGLDFIKK